MEFYEYLTIDEYILPVVALACFIAGVLLGRRLPRYEEKKGARLGRGGREKQQNVSEVYVGNLPYEMTETDLRKMFARFGKVLSARIIVNKSSGASKGYGFVRMPDHAEALAAINALDSTEIDGRRIVVSEARTPARN